MKKLFAVVLLASAFAGGARGAEKPVSPFGIGSSASSGNIPEKWLPQMTEIGVRILRNPRGTGWAGGAHGPWATLDKHLEYLKSIGVETGGTFYYHGKPQGFPLTLLPEWVEEVKGVSKHTRGRIKYWELWNEPPNGTRNAPASDYAAYTVATYDAAKAGNPDCLIGLAAKSVDINYLDQAIRSGAKGHFDYVTLHPYETLGCVVEHPGFEPLFMSIVPTLRKMLAARDPERTDAPLWFTEIGYDSRRGVELQAGAVVKTYTMSIAQGVACVNWFEGLDGDSGPLGLLEAGGKPRPAYTALGLLVKYLGEYPNYLGWVFPGEGNFGFVFQGAEGPLMVTWGQGELVETGGTMIDLLTGETVARKSVQSPALIVSVSAALVEQAKANKSKPFPWGGDYTDAKEVSITFGEKNVERGLHTQSAEAVAANVVLYGGNARAGNIPGGNIFTVDPNFLSYTATPIEIRIVVRRMKDDVNAGFNLKYESVDGMKGNGWFTVPAGREWTEKSWVIKDPQFVAKYGFNFTLDSDGNKFNQYEIQSVTVKKL